MASRRDLLKTLPLYCVSPTATPQVKPSSQIKRVGDLNWGKDSDKPLSQRKFWIEMGKRGWTLDKNLLVEPAYANGDAAELKRLVARLVRSKVDVILTDGGITSAAAARATKTIPILFDNVWFPIEQELVNSYAHPGGNLTGFAPYSEMEVSVKRLQFLREIAPRAKRLAWLSIEENIFQAEKVSGGIFDTIPLRREAAKRIGFDAEFHYVKTAQELDGVFAMVAAQRAEVITCGAWTFEPVEQVPNLVLRQRLPSAFADMDCVKAGGLLSFTAAESEYDLIRNRMAAYLDRVLRGELPANLPVEQPTRFELAVNLKTAKALGLKLPQSILLRADVIVD